MEVPILLRTYCSTHIAKLLLYAENYHVLIKFQVYCSNIKLRNCMVFVLGIARSYDIEEKSNLIQLRMDNGLDTHFVV